MKSACRAVADIGRYRMVHGRLRRERRPLMQFAIQIRNTTGEINHHD